MLTISFHNDGTGTAQVGNYDVTVRVNSVVIDRARVEGYDRAQDWRALVAQLLAQAGVVGERQNEHTT